MKAVPAPVAVFGGKSTGTIAKNTAAAQTGVYASLPDFEFDLVYKITAFTVLYTDARGDFEEKAIQDHLRRNRKTLSTGLHAVRTFS